MDAHHHATRLRRHVDTKVHGAPTRARVGDPVDGDRSPSKVVRAPGVPGPSASDAVGLTPCGPAEESRRSRGTDQPAGSSWPRPAAATCRGLETLWTVRESMSHSGDATLEGWPRRHDDRRGQGRAGGPAGAGWRAADVRCLGGHFRALGRRAGDHFVHIAAEAVDDHIEAALGRVATALDLDRSTVTQWVDRHFQVTHQWVRAGFPRAPAPLIPEDVLPWVAERVFRRQEPVLLTRMSDFPPEASRDRAFAERTGARAAVVLPLVVGGATIGALSIGDLRREREWPARWSTDSA